jgi:hypothetical protein
MQREREPDLRERVKSRRGDLLDLDLDHRVTGNASALSSALR